MIPSFFFQIKTNSSKPKFFGQNKIKIELIDLVKNKTRWLRKRYNHLVDTDSYLFKENNKKGYGGGKKDSSSERIITVYTTQHYLAARTIWRHW